jgi:hypothetical protein
LEKKFLSLVLLLFVVIGFSGVASAASHQVLVKDAYDEQVLVKSAWTQVIPGTPDKTINHPAEYKTVHYDAVYKTVVVTPEIPAYDEQKLVKEAYDETVEADHDGWTLNSAKQVQQKQGQKPINAQKYPIGTIKNNYKVIDDVGCGVNKIWQTLTTIKHHDAVYETVHHDTVPAVTKQELVTDAYDKQEVVKEAWTEVIKGTPDQFIQHTAEYKTVHHEAVYVTVEDPVVPINEEIPVADNANSNKPTVSKANTIPMQHTGLPMAPVVGAILAILGGGIFARRV